MEEPVKRLLEEWLSHELSETALRSHYMIFKNLEDMGVIRSASSALFGKIWANALQVVLNLKNPPRNLGMYDMGDEVISEGDLEKLTDIFLSKSAWIRGVIERLDAG